MSASTSQRHPRWLLPFFGYVNAVYGHRCDGGRFLCVSRTGTCGGSAAVTSQMRAIAREWQRLGAERLGPPLPALL